MKTMAKLALCSLLLGASLQARADGIPHILAFWSDAWASLFASTDDTIPHITL